MHHHPHGNPVLLGAAIFEFGGIVAATTLGSVIRRRRRQLEVTQQEVARRVGVRANYIGYLERDMRRPSTNVLVKLAKVLDLDREELFFLAHPQVRSFIRTDGPDPQESAWNRFRADKRLHTRQGITQRELKVLQQVSTLGDVHSTRDYLFILQAIRQALQEG
jgi:transcriptional regulator with XRE-family HTH domain